MSAATLGCLVVLLIIKCFVFLACVPPGDPVGILPWPVPHATHSQWGPKEKEGGLGDFPTLLHNIEYLGEGFGGDSWVGFC